MDLDFSMLAGKFALINLDHRRRLLGRMFERLNDRNRADAELPRDRDYIPRAYR